MVRLILASQSPARLETLRSAGIEPTVRVSGVDEDAVLAEHTGRHGVTPTAVEVPAILARVKAETVASTVSEPALVLGCDSVLELDGEVHGKPSGAAEARARWQRMRGRSGVLHTGHWLIDARAAGRGEGGHPAHGAVASTVVTFADVTDDEIDAYVATGEPRGVAGAFTIDGLGGPFVSGIQGDHHNVVGLSLPLLRDLLTRLDLTVMDLWRGSD